MGAVLSSLVRPVHVVLTRGIWPCRGEEDIRARKEPERRQSPWARVTAQGPEGWPSNHTYKSLNRGFRATGMVGGNRMSQLKYMVALPHLARVLTRACAG